MVVVFRVWRGCWARANKQGMVLTCVFPSLLEYMVVGVAIGWLRLCAPDNTKRQFMVRVSYSRLHKRYGRDRS